MRWRTTELQAVLDSIKENDFHGASWGIENMMGSLYMLPKDYFEDDGS
jgi:hypothetical protein